MSFRGLDTGMLQVRSLRRASCCNRLPRLSIICPPLALGTHWKAWFTRKPRSGRPSSEFACEMSFLFLQMSLFKEGEGGGKTREQMERILWPEMCISYFTFRQLPEGGVTRTCTHSYLHKSSGPNNRCASAGTRWHPSGPETRKAVKYEWQRCWWGRAGGQQADGLKGDSHPKRRTERDIAQSLRVF